MDALGDGDGFDDLSPERAAVLTPEARALTAASLVFAGLFASGLFQFLGFFLAAGTDGVSPGWQYAIFAGPSGALAAAGAWTGWSVRDEPQLAPTLRGLAAASAVVGAVIAVAVAVGLVAGFSLGPDQF